MPFVFGSTASRGQASRSRNQAYTSPNADCPASRPIMPGMMEPSTWPQMPVTHFAPTARFGATSMSQVEVPMIFTSVRSVIWPPAAPMCASKAPTATATPGRRPSRRAHSSVRPPAFCRR